MNQRKIVMIRKGLKAIGLIFLFGVSLGSVYLVNLFFMKPASIDHYLGKEIVVDLFSSPEYMTYMGIFDDLSWVTKHNAKLTILKSDNIQDEIKSSQNSLELLRKYKDGSVGRLDWTETCCPRQSSPQPVQVRRAFRGCVRLLANGAL